MNPITAWVRFWHWFGGCSEIEQTGDQEWTCTNPRCGKKTNVTPIQEY